jgi:hypothetical protein
MFNTVKYGLLLGFNQKRHMGLHAWLHDVQVHH